jgi:hypothetical protein
VPGPQFGRGSLFRTDWNAPADCRAVALRSIEFLNSGDRVPVLVGTNGVMER